MNGEIIIINRNNNRCVISTKVYSCIIVHGVPENWECGDFVSWKEDHVRNSQPLTNSTKRQMKVCKIVEYGVATNSAKIHLDLKGLNG